MTDDRSSDPTLEWLGCTTFRLRVGDLTLLLDTYVDRPASAPPVGVTAADLSADFVFISHSHFDHIVGADVVAKNSGAPVAGSYESIRLLREANVPEAQLIPVSGGETVDCGHGVRVRVYPALHSCVFTDISADSGAECVGDLGISQQDRLARSGDLLASAMTASPALAEWWAATVKDAPHSPQDGGQLIYLIESGQGSILFSASSGCWSPILRELNPDIALLACVGRPNLDGEPFQGSLAEFMVREIEMLMPRKVVLCHHDAFAGPEVSGEDTTAAVRAIQSRCSYTELVDMTYLNAVPIFH
jgi:L-ascorbate metabolism protein UlaG (beta-lactamase superfamily)